MIIEYPSALLSFMSFLEKENGFVLEEEQYFPKSFGDVITIFSSQDLHVRLMRDRTVWSIEFREDQKPQKWYDLHFIMAVMTGTTGDDPVPLEEYVAFAQSNWKAIVSLFSAENAMQTHATMEFFFRERRKRLYPEVKD